MTLPPEVKIGPYRYTVVVADEHVPASDGRGWATGQFDYHKLTLTVVKGEPTIMLATFIHELLHAVGHQTGVWLSEKQTDRFANGLTALLVDNDFFADLLIAAE